ncbi:MAG TPA: aminotransferase class V-fold PLP-dependent enzyme [Vicinamibacterales bacterium]
MDWSECRRLFPVTDELVFLNNAAESPLNLAVRRRLDEYLDLAARAPHNRPPARNPVRVLLSRLLGGLPEEYALVTSTAVGIGLTAAGYRWEPGDNVVVPAQEHWNNTFPWLALRDRGIDVRIAPVDADSRVDPARIADRIDARTRIVALAAVRHGTGFRADLKLVSRMARDRGALFVVDGIQAAGVVPLNVEDDGIDVLACGGFKWLLGLPGTGFLYVRKDAWERIRPTMPGMFSAEDDLTEIRWLPGARRYESGSLSYSLFHAWTAGLEMLLEIGVPAIHARVLDLTSRLIDALRVAGMTILTPVETREERSAIVSFTAGSQEQNQAIVARLIERKIAIALRVGSCRVSPSFYNTEEEIDRFQAALAKI